MGVLQSTAAVTAVNKALFSEGSLQSRGRDPLFEEGSEAYDRIGGWQMNSLIQDAIDQIDYLSTDADINC